MEINLDTLIADATDDSVPTVVLVTKLKVFAQRMDIAETTRWCALELDGYTRDNPEMLDTDKVPPYRMIPGVYFDAYGREVGLPQEALDTGIQLAILNQPLSELQQLAESSTHMLSMRDYRRFRLILETMGISVADFQVARQSIGTVVKTIRDKAVERVMQMTDQNAKDPNVSTILRVFDKLRLSSLPLNRRRKGKPVFSLDDEYDVQDLLQSLLTPWFPDIRKEEWAPSRAGASKRMDLLIKDEKIAIETKFVRSGAHAKKIKDEITIDIEDYAEHKDVITLVALIYDPNLSIANRAAMENDLSGARRIKGKDLNVVCSVRPDG